MHTLSSILQVFCKSWLRMVHRGFLSTTEIESSFFFQFPPAWRVIINEKNGRSLFLSSLLQYSSSISDLGREIETHDARTLIAFRYPCLFLCTCFLSPYIQMISPSLLRGWFLSRGVKRGGRAHFSTLSFRMKKSGRNIELFYPRAWRKHQTGSRPDFILAITCRREERSSP